MTLIKWDPFHELEGIQARLNRLYGDLPARRSDEEADFFTNWAPAVDIHETDAEYIVKADLPDVKKEDVKVELEAGVLTVQGERKQEKEEKGKKFHKIERQFGKFVRRFALPTEIDGTKVHAEFKDGVLNVRLPKTAIAKPKAIEVKVA
jgi:HSP20 family protein